MGEPKKPKTRAQRRAARKAKALDTRPGGGQFNRLVVMTYTTAERTVPTADPFDRAHDVRDTEGYLVSAASLNGQARARRYPEVYMVGPAQRRVSFETAFDDLHARECWLRSEGLAVGPKRVTVAVHEQIAAADPVRFRDLVVRRKIRQRVPSSVAELSRQASAILRAAAEQEKP